jgi:hypothetical protein
MMHLDQARVAVVALVDLEQALDIQSHLARQSQSQLVVVAEVLLQGLILYLASSFPMAAAAAVDMMGPPGVRLAEMVVLVAAAAFM